MTSLLDRIREKRLAPFDLLMYAETARHLGHPELAELCELECEAQLAALDVARRRRVNWKGAARWAASVSISASR
jgi:hypothetical protein